MCLFLFVCLFCFVFKEYHSFCHLSVTATVTLASISPAPSAQVDHSTNYLLGFCKSSQVQVCTGNIQILLQVKKNWDSVHHEVAGGITSSFRPHQFDLSYLSLFPFCPRNGLYKLDFFPVPCFLYSIFDSSRFLCQLHLRNTSRNGFPAQVDIVHREQRSQVYQLFHASTA